MKIAVKILVYVDINFIYHVAKPIKPKREVFEWVKEQIRFLTDMRATDESGHWTLPDEVNLIQMGIGEYFEIKDKFKKWSPERMRDYQNFDWETHIK